MKQQKGFTLIELIIVIVILGIVAVTAAPRFFDFSKDARVSTIGGLKAAVQGASQTVYAMAAINGELDETGTHNGEAVADGGIATVYGYPAATKVAIQTSASLADSDWDFDETTTAGTVYIMSKDVAYSATATEQCHVEYAQSTGANIAPIITSHTGGC